MSYPARAEGLVNRVNSAVCGIALLKNDFNLAEIFVLCLFKVAANQTECSRLEQRSLIKVLVTEKCKQ